jgi:checkpoint serine/threonine-protein kinase
MHEAGFLHGDFKIDNCLLRLEEAPGGNARGWSGAYSRSGSGGWASKGVKMIDFGRTVDLKAFPEGQTFNPKWTTDKHDCSEVRAGRPWTYQPDYYGLACIAHVMLFGKYLETIEDGQGRTIVKEPLKRYHQAGLWNPFFDLLLNPTRIRQDESLPLTKELAGIREEMESWLELNSEKAGKNLKGLLKKLEIHALASRR